MTASHDAWTPVFKMWPTFELTQPNIAPEKITPAELKRRVKAATRQHEANLVSMALATIMGHYRCEVHDEDEVYPCDSIEDFFIRDEHYVHCYSLNTGEFVGWFLFIPNNGSPSDSFCDWSAENKQFDEFLDGMMEAFDE